MKLRNKVAIITGAASGIGKELAFAFGREGAVVCIFDVDISGAREVAQQIEEEVGVKARAFEVNVTDLGQIKKAVNKIEDVFQKIDILVNNAAWIKYSPFLEFGEKDWDRIMRVCLKGYFLCGQAVAQKMVKEGKGKIINIASIAGQIAMPGSSGYGSAKGGIIALTKIMALELARYNINVNAIAPGPILTPLLERTLSLEDKERRIQRIPAKRLGRPKDIAGPAVFLASDDSNYVVGHTLNVDGGFVAAGMLE